MNMIDLKAWYIAKKNVKEKLKNYGTMFWTVAFPIMMLIVYKLAFTEGTDDTTMINGLTVFDVEFPGIVVYTIGISTVSSAVMFSMSKRGRPKGQKTNILLLDYRTWQIIYDGSAWPCVNYILQKKGIRNVAYCSTLEGALKIMYDEMLVDYVNRKNDYGAKFLDLVNAINKTKKDISRLFEILPKLEIEIKKEKTQFD